MTSIVVRSSYALAFFIGAFFGLSSSGFAQQSLSEHDLVAALRQGGYVIYLRHAETDVSKTDQDRDVLADWTKQRNLSTKGREQAVLIGNAFRTLSIPLGEIKASPYCRCVETAKLAFGKATPHKDLAFSIGTEKHEAERLADALRIMLGTRPSAGKNTVLVAHTANLQEAAKIWPKPEGVAFIFKPLGNKNFEMIEKIEVQQWAHLAKKVGVTTTADREPVRLPDRKALCGE
jgi:phosphohistidine phosphatase SixA